MQTHAQTQKTAPARRRPMYGSVWLALFVLLRDGLNDPDGPDRSAPIPGGSPSHRR